MRRLIPRLLNALAKPRPKQYLKRTMRPRVELLEGRDCPSSSTIQTPAIAIFGTGETSAGAVLTPGTVDAHYKIVSSPDSDHPVHAYSVIQNGFPFNGYWSGPHWIAPDRNINDVDSNGHTEPVGTFDYRTTFSLAGRDLSTAQLSLTMAADNYLSILLNGATVYTSTDPQMYRHPAQVTITSGFLGKQNTLDFIVTNLPQTDWKNNLHNPSGLSVEASGTALYATKTKLSATPNPTVFGQAVTLTAKVTAAAGVPSGSVTFYDGSTALGGPVSLDATGTAVLTTTDLSVGSHALTAQYSGDAADAASHSYSVGHVVHKSATTTALTLSAETITSGDSVTLTATVTPNSPGAGLPSGMVAFYDGNHQIGTIAVVDGVAVLQAEIPKAKTHTLRARYEGDESFLASTSKAEALAVERKQGPTTDGLTSKVANEPPAVPGNSTYRFSVFLGVNDPSQLANVAWKIKVLGGEAGVAKLESVSGEVSGDAESPTYLVNTVTFGNKPSQVEVFAEYTDQGVDYISRPIKIDVVQVAIVPPKDPDGKLLPEFDASSPSQGAVIPTDPIIDGSEVKLVPSTQIVSAQLAKDKYGLAFNAGIDLTGEGADQITVGFVQQLQFVASSVSFATSKKKLVASLVSPTYFLDANPFDPSSAFYKFNANLLATITGPGKNGMSQTIRQTDQPSLMFPLMLGTDRGTSIDLRWNFRLDIAAITSAEPTPTYWTEAKAMPAKAGETFSWYFDGSGQLKAGGQGNFTWKPGDQAKVQAPSKWQVVEQAEPESVKGERANTRIGAVVWKSQAL